MEFIDTIMGFLSGYREQVNLGLVAGTIASLVAVAIGVVIFLIRYAMLTRRRLLDHEEEIKAGAVEGQAEGLRMRREELSGNQGSEKNSQPA